MSTWFVAVDGKSRGPFSQEQIVEGLNAGLYTPQTLLWKNGYDTWQPLAEVPEFRQGKSAFFQVHPLHCQNHAAL